MSSKIYQEGTNYAPKIILDPQKNKFEISGNSMIIDAEEFYCKIANWFHENITSINDEFSMLINLQFISTSTSKALSNIFKSLHQLQKEHNKSVKIIWYYDNEDLDILEKGKEFNSIISLPFEFITY